MKKYVIRKQGEGSDTYTIFNNPNTELKKQISNFKCDTNTVEMGWPSRKWTILEKDGDEYKCQSDRDISYFKVSDVEKNRIEYIEEQRNSKFLAFEHFKSCFGIITEYTPNYNLSILDLTDGMSMGRIVGMNTNINTMSVEAYFTQYEYEINKYQELSLKCGVHGQNMCLYFTPYGDFINRDYNINLENYSQDTISPTVILNELKTLIYNEVGEKTLEYSKGIYYTSTHCYVIYTSEKNNEFGIEVIPVRHDGKSYQIHSGYTIYKKPAKTVQKTVNELWDELMSALTPLQKCLVSDDYLNYKNYINEQ